jgi:hypothetical protein
MQVETRISPAAVQPVAIRSSELLFHYVIEGRGLGSALAEMDRSGRVRVIGPHINAAHGASGDRQVMMVAVEAESPGAGEELLWGYLEPRNQYAISTALRQRRWADPRPAQVLEESATHRAGILKDTADLGEESVDRSPIDELPASDHQSGIRGYYRRRQPLGKLHRAS